MTNTQSPAPGARRVVEKSNCVCVHEGNVVIGSFTGPDAKQNAEAFAGLQASAAAVPAFYANDDLADSFAKGGQGGMWVVTEKYGNNNTPLYTAPPLPAQVQEAEVTDAEIEHALKTFQEKLGHNEVERMRQVLRNFLASRTPAPGNVADWGIDTSTGTKILVHKNCSVIQDEQAELVLRLLGAPGMAGGVGTDKAKGLSVKDAMRCGICGKTGFHYHTNHGEELKTSVTPAVARIWQEQGLTVTEHPSPAPQAAGADSMEHKVWTIKEWALLHLGPSHNITIAAVAAHAAITASGRDAS